MRMSEITKRMNYRILTARGFIGAVLSTLIILNSCSTTNQVRAWSTSAVFDGKINKILAMGLVNNTSRRFNVESKMVDAARGVQLNSTKGMRMFPPELGRPFQDTDRMLVRLQEMGFDAILTVAIIDVTAERYIPPERRYVPMGYYNRFGSYYSRTYTVVYRKGYISRETRYFLETNLYEVKNGTLIWSGRSHSFNPQDFESFVPRYARSVFNELQKAGYIGD